MLQSMRSAAKYIWIVLIIAFVGGFLLVDSSGLLGRAPVTQNTAVATVNGEDVLYFAWQQAVTNLEQQEAQRLGRGVTLDERRRLEQQAFDELVNDVLLRQEYERRGIRVTDEEIVQAAQTNPPPGFMQSPDFQTDGQFDLGKYQAFLASPVARQQGLLASLEQFYRTEIPRQKLLDQVSSDVWVSDARLWQIFRDRNDSAVVSYVAFRTGSGATTAPTVGDDEVRRYYNDNRDEFERPGRAVLSLLTIPRTVTAADTAAALARVEAIRAEIAGGADFAEVARRESVDSVSGANGGALGRGGRGRFVAPFETAAYALRVGELSEPVLTNFGYHLIRVDDRDGDTLDLRHILIAIQQSDSSAALTDRRADSLIEMASGVLEPEQFDRAATALGLTPSTVVAFEDEPLTFASRYVPGASAWAFSGSQIGESSDLFDAPDAYYLARLDSLRAGGIAPLEDVREDIRRRLQREKELEALRPIAERFVGTARGSSLDAAARDLGVPVETAGPFARTSLVPGLGQFTTAVGAAFGLEVGQIGNPVASNDAVYVLRLDRFVPADSAAFTAQLPILRNQVAQGMRNERIEAWLDGVRERANITDRRKEIQALLRRSAEETL